MNHSLHLPLYLLLFIYFLTGVQSSNIYAEALSNDPFKKETKNYFIDDAVEGNLPVARLEGVNLFAHGRSGELLINGTWHNARAIESFIKSRFDSQLFEGKEINIFGCEFAKGSKGMQAVRYLENHLHCNINASTNITGKDGDWLLEYGQKNTEQLFSSYRFNLQAACVADNTGNTANISNELLWSFPDLETFTVADPATNRTANQLGESYNTFLVEAEGFSSTYNASEAIILIDKVLYWSQRHHNDADAWFAWNSSNRRWEASASNNNNLIQIYPLSATLDGVNVPIEYITIENESDVPNEIYIADITDNQRHRFRDGATRYNFLQTLDSFPYEFPYVDLGGLTPGQEKDVVITMAIEFANGRNAYTTSPDGGANDLDWEILVSTWRKSTGYDYGDADGYVAAGHAPDMCAPSLYIGDVRPDMETGTTTDGANTVSGDLNAYVNDEADLGFPDINRLATSYSLTVPYNNNTGAVATLAVWIDFNNDGIFDASEKQNALVSNGSGNHTFSWAGITVHPTAPQLVTRVRIASDATEVENPSGFASNGEVEDHAIIVSTTAVLPIKLLDFQGKKVGDSHLLNWSSSSEVNTIEYELLHGTAANDLKKIATIPTQAVNLHSSTTLNYSYTHITPAAGHNYYQLSTVDRDGKVNKFNIISLYELPKGTLTVYPNPVDNILNISITEAELDVVTLQLTDLTGRVVYQNRIELNMENLDTKVELNNLAGGIYMLNITDDNGYQSVQKIYKK